MPATSPTPRARWLAPLLLLLGSVFFTLIWIMLALYLERPCTWMAVLGAIDAALILRFAGMPAGWARAAWAMLATIRLRWAASSARSEGSIASRLSSSTPAP